MYYYKVWSTNKNAHLWAYEKFKEDTKADLIDYQTNGNIILYMVYGVPQIVECSVFELYGLCYQPLIDDVEPTPIVTSTSPVNNSTSTYPRYKEPKKKYWCKKISILMIYNNRLPPISKSLLS